MVRPKLALIVYLLSRNTKPCLTSLVIGDQYFYLSIVFIVCLRRYIRGGIQMKVQKSSCVKTERLLRKQSMPNETYIQKEEKMYS